MTNTVSELNGEDGLGGTFFVMTNTVMAMVAIGYPEDHPDLVTAKTAIRKMMVEKEDEAYCQPCLSPIWDTALTAQALMEAGCDSDDPSIRKAMDWIADKQILDVYGDWSENRPDVRPGGWAFQYGNDHYPDVDDTAAVAIAMHRAGFSEHADNLDRAEEWVIPMQSANGGWGAFDADNTHSYLNHIPFADHGALLDPPTSDVTARCISMLGQLGYQRDHEVIQKGIDYLKSEQEEDGSWYGRWGTNYIYGTWSVMTALEAITGFNDQGIVIVDQMRKAVQNSAGPRQSGCCKRASSLNSVSRSEPSRSCHNCSSNRSTTSRNAGCVR